jgi:predicted small secreted protein
MFADLIDGSTKAEIVFVDFNCDNSTSQLEESQIHYSDDNYVQENNHEQQQQNGLIVVRELPYGEYIIIYDATTMQVIKVTKNGMEVSPTPEILDKIKASGLIYKENKKHN